MDPTSFQSGLSSLPASAGEDHLPKTISVIDTKISGLNNLNQANNSKTDNKINKQITSNKTESLQKLANNTNEVASGSQTFQAVLGTEEHLLTSQAGELSATQTGTSGSSEIIEEQVSKPSGTSGSSEIIKEQVSKPLSLSDREDRYALDKEIYNDWKKDIIQNSVHGAKYAQIKMDFNRFASGDVKTTSFEESIHLLLHQEYPHKFISVTGMMNSYKTKTSKVLEFGENENKIHSADHLAQRTVWDEDKKTRRIPYDAQLETDILRANYKINGNSIKDENENPDKDKNEKPDIKNIVIQTLTKMGEMGIPDKDIFAVTSIFNQRLLNPAAMFLMTRFDLMVGAVTSGDKEPSIDLRLAESAHGSPIIEANMTLLVRDNKDPDEEDNFYFIPVEILVTNLDSSDPDLPNTHYYFGPPEKNQDLTIMLRRLKL